MDEFAHVSSDAARVLRARGIASSTPEWRSANAGKAARASTLARKSDPQARLIRAYGKYVQAWKVAARYLERHPGVKRVNVPDPTGIDIHKLLEQQAKLPSK